MNASLIFTIVNWSVLPAWLLLVFLPRARVTRVVVHSGLYPLVLGTVYAFLLFGDQPGPQGASFFSLDGVMRIFTSPRTVIAAWAHYLIFDLFIGAWETRDAQRVGLPHLAVVPCLVLTLMLGPIGLASYLLLRAALRRRLSLIETTAAA